MKWQQSISAYKCTSVIRKSKSMIIHAIRSKINQCPSVAPTNHGDTKRTKIFSFFNRGWTQMNADIS
jgi:hypothetical protein